MNVFPVQHSYGISQTTGLLSAQQLVKAADQSVTNSVALIDDNTLVVQIGPNQVLVWRAVLIWSGNSPGNAKMQFVTPAAPASGCYWFQYLDAAAVYQNGIGATLASYNANINLADNAGAGSELVSIFEGRLVNGVNGGQFKIQWAQNAANATPTTLAAGSRLDGWVL